MHIYVYLRSSAVTLPDATKVSKISALERTFICVIPIDLRLFFEILLQLFVPGINIP